MLTQQHYTLLLGKHRSPFLVADSITDEILYLNEKMSYFLKDTSHILGKPLSEVLALGTKLSQIETMPLCQSGEIREQHLYNHALKQSYLVTHMYLNIESRDYHFCQFEASDQVDFNFEDTMTKCIHAVQGAEEERIPSLLRILGEYYNAEKVYLYQIKYSENSIPCHTVWVRNEEVSITHDLSEKMDVDTLLQWFERRNDVGMIEASRSLLKEDSFIEEQVLNAYQLENIVMSVVETRTHEALGMVVLSNRDNEESDFRLLQAVTHFVERDITHDSVTAMPDLQDVDILTGFYNRIAYSCTLEVLEQRPPKRLGVILANVNGLKRLNSVHGLAEGDCYIKRAAELLKSHFSAEFFRTAGDEFVGIFPDIDKEVFQQQVNDLQEEMKRRDNHIFAVGHAWGKGRVDALELVRESDTVMYINKQEYYHQRNHEFHDIEDTTLQDLLTAIEEGEFLIYLQPQVFIEDGSLYGAEALIRRFDRKKNQMLYPDQFIALYEQKSVIRHVDIFVIEKVCEILRHWKTKGIQIPVSVNLSRVTLLEYGIVDTIAAICDQHQIQREFLVIEVTERVGLIESNVPSTLVNEFKEQGFKISLDDFGCAYSNIVTLAQIEVDEVKIDKSLVDYLATNDKNRLLVKNVLAMCHDLDRTSTLAEGIEDAEQAALLHSLGCHLGQGYFYSEPIPVDDFSDKYFHF